MHALISIHAPHEGERLHKLLPCLLYGYFNPRSPRGGATFYSFPISSTTSYFNPRSPRGGATFAANSITPNILISIHAPHEGERLVSRGSAPQPQEISIHAPHEGERQRKSAFVYSISANLLNIIHCGTVTRAVSRRRIALFRLFSVRRSGVFMYAYASH